MHESRQLELRLRRKSDGAVLSRETEQELIEALAELILEVAIAEKATARAGGGDDRETP